MNSLVSEWLFQLLTKKLFVFSEYFHSFKDIPSYSASWILFPHYSLHSRKRMLFPPTTKTYIYPAKYKQDVPQGLPSLSLSQQSKEAYFLSHTHTLLFSSIATNITRMKERTKRKVRKRGKDIFLTDILCCSHSLLCVCLCVCVGCLDLCAVRGFTCTLFLHICVTIIV